MGFTKWYDSDEDIFKGVHDPGLTVATDRSRLAKPTGATGKVWTIFSGNNKNGFGPNDRRNVTRVANTDRPGHNMLHMVMQRQAPAPGYNASLPLSGGVYPWYGARGGIYGLAGATRNFMLELITRCNLGAYTKNAHMSWPDDSAATATYNELDWEEVTVGAVMGSNAATTIWYSKNGARQHSPVTWSRPPSSWQTLWRLERCVRLSTGIKMWVGNMDGSSMVLVYDSTTKDYNSILNASSKLMTQQPYGFAIAQYNLSAHSIYDQTVDKSGWMDIARVRLSTATLDTTWAEVPTGGIDDTGTLPQNVPSVPTNFVASSTGQNSNRITWSASQSNGLSPLSGYELQWAPAAGNVVTGSWSNVPGTSPIPTQSFNHTGLTANTQYAYRVRAVNANGLKSAFTGTQFSTTDSSAPGTPDPVAHLNVLTADLSDSSDAGPLVVDAPSSLMLDMTTSSGTFNQQRVTSQLLPSGAVIDLYPAQAPMAAAVPIQLVDPGVYELVGYATDVATSRVSKDVVQVTVADPNAENELFSPNLEIEYPTEGEELTIEWARDLINRVDALPAQMAYRARPLQDGEVALSVQNDGDDYAWLVIDGKGMHVADGSVDPYSTTPFIDPNNLSAPQIPQANPATYFDSTENESVAAGSSNPTVTLPTGIPAGSYAVVAYIQKATDYALNTQAAGWTVLAEGHHLNGNTSFHVLGKAVGVADSGASIALSTQGGSVLWISEAYIAQKTTAVDQKSLFIPSTSSAQQSHPVNPIKINYKQQLVLVIWAGRGTTNGSNTQVTPPDSMTPREQDNTPSTTATNMAMTMADIVIASPSDSQSFASGTSGSGFFGLSFVCSFVPTNP